MVDILISIAAKVAEYTVAPIGRQLGYLFCYKQNVEDLNTKIVGLRRAKERLQHDVDEAQRKGEIIEADVSDWFTKADKIITEDHEDFTRHEEQANTKFTCGAQFPNLVLRHRLSRRAKKMAEKVATQIQDREKIQKVSYCPPLPNSVENKGIYEGFESRNQTLTDVMKALRDPSVGRVGVWGMGGVGKTMLAKEVARRAKDEEKLFTTVVFITISKDPTVEKIQQEIGEKLGMQFPEESKDARAQRLAIRLRKENNLLIILDDIWDQLDLEDVGISFGIDQKGCKIFFTTRYSHVLANDMGVDNNAIFRVGDLLEHEAMSLFRKIVGNPAERHDDDFRDLATKIVKECRGLPIAITTVASALKNKGRAVWENALQELKNSNPINVPGMHKKVYASIKLSYDALESEEAKLLLLLCSLFKEDANIHVEKELCKYGIGLNLFEGVNTLEEARNKMVTLVTNLKDHSLLLNGNYDDRVKLHDVTRDVVIFIASKLDHHHRMHNIRNADELEKYVNKEMFKDSTAISLYNIKADQYPQTLKTPELNLLRLERSYGQEDSRKLPHQFFGVLKRLLVLDSVGVSLVSLPTASSFCLFPNLQTLRLRWCNLGDISWIGELKNLKILDLSCNSSITELPRGIGKLNRLLSLNLERCDGIKVIEPNVISRLTRLEELNLKNSFTNWEVDGVVNGDERRNANLSEVTNLPHLIDLNLDVPDINSVPKDMFSEQWKKYHINIGADRHNFVKATSRTLTLKLCPNSVLNEHDFEALLKKSEALYLNGFKRAKSLAFEIDRIGFKHLKHLTVKESTEIRCIVNSNNGNMDYLPAAFPSLESLDLTRLMSLENIIHGKLTTETSFGKLKKIYVENCDNLKSLFPLFNIPKQLQSIEVSRCTMMEEIISHHAREGDNVEKNEFSQLQRLRLAELPKIVQFIGTRKPDGIKCEGQSIDNSVAPLFNGQILFPELDCLLISSLNIRKIWNDDQLTTETSFGKLTQIEVWYCEKLRSLFPLFNIPRQLKMIEVSGCTMMEEIITCNGRECDHVEKIEFSQLQRLVLSKLPKLGQVIATRKSDEIKSEGQSIDDSIAPLFNGQVLFPKLDYLLISSLNIRKIWNDDQLTTETSFEKLTQIEVTYCEKLKSLLPLFNIPRQLKRIKVSECTMMEEIITHHGREGDHVEKIEFSQLQRLVFSKLPKLGQFIATRKSDEIKNEGQSIDNSVASLFNGQVLFPELDYLLISSLNIQKIWNDDQLTTETSFGKLTQIEVSNCEKLKSLFPLFNVPRQLKRIEVRKCTMMEEIITHHGREGDHIEKIEFSQLQRLVLSKLPRLGQFIATKMSNEIKNEGQSINDSVEALFNGQVVFPKLEELYIISLNIRKFSNDNQLSSSRFGFQNLTEIVVRKCDHLKGLISSFMSASLVHLRRLTVASCEAMKEIFFIEESAQVMGNYISFPKLESLVLSNLPNLERFCGGGISFPQLEYLRLQNIPNLERFCGGDCVDCPSLLKLKISGCLKLRIFVTNNIPTTSTKKENKNLRGFVDKQHHSPHKDVVKVELSTESSCSEITCQPHPLAYVEEHDDMDMFFKTKRLSDLKLWNFPYLQQLPKTFPQSVESLSIWEWGIRSKDLATPLMSFQNLKVLKVRDCHGLTSLLSPSTAKSLSQQLTDLSISGCKSLTQVIANDHKEADDDDHEIIADNIIIVFSQLKFLLLDDLSSLTSFYSGNNNVVLQFPHLDKLIVGDCPEMKTFYHGIIDCPSLHKINLCKLKVDDDDDDADADDDDDADADDDVFDFEYAIEKVLRRIAKSQQSYWKGDINTTVQKLWEDKNIRDPPESERECRRRL